MTRQRVDCLIIATLSTPTGLTMTIQTSSSLSAQSSESRFIERGVAEPWRRRAFGILRIVFGLVWAIDAAFKWQPAFQTGFVDYLTGALDGQPTLVKAWIGFWVNVVQVNPHVFALIVAASETALAVALILGALSNLANLGGVFLTLVIWSTAEGFGGPYKAGSTDIGAAIIYFFVFVALFLSQSGLYLGLDRRLTPMLGRWSWLASGPLGRRTPIRRSGLEASDRLPLNSPKTPLPSR